MKSVGERLDHYRSGIRNRVRYQVNVVSWDNNEIGKATVRVVHPKKSPCRAAVLSSGTACRALTARDKRIDRNSLSLNGRFTFNDHAHSLVAEDETRLSSCAVAKKTVDIRAANAGGRDFYFDLALSWSWLGNLP